MKTKGHEIRFALVDPLDKKIGKIKKIDDLELDEWEVWLRMHIQLKIKISSHHSIMID